MVAWREVGEGVYHRRYDPLDISVCVIRGGEGLLVVDTRSSHREAAEILADLRQLADQAVRWVVNTHAHFDHCFGTTCSGRRPPWPRRYMGTNECPPISSSSRSRCWPTGSSTALNRWRRGEK